MRPIKTTTQCDIRDKIITGSFLSCFLQLHVRTRIPQKRAAISVPISIRHGQGSHFRPQSDPDVELLGKHAGYGYNSGVLAILRNSGTRQWIMGDPVVCQVERNGRLMYVAFEIDL
jgi:hypothetical protein